MKDNVATTRRPLLTLALIVAILAVALYTLTVPGDQASDPTLGAEGISQRDELKIDFGATPYRITHPGSECRAERRRGIPTVICAGEGAELAARRGSFAPLDPAPWWLTLLTSLFLYGSVVHLLGNMLALWLFGRAVEDSMGSARFGAFLLVAGIGSTYLQAALDTSSTVPMIGSSGAVAAVVGAYLLLHWRARVLTFVLVVLFFTFIEIPAVILAGVWFALQFLPAVGQLDSTGLADPGVPYLAHVGGLLLGLAMIHLFAQRDRTLGETSEITDTEGGRA